MEPVPQEVAAFDEDPVVVGDVERPAEAVAGAPFDAGRERCPAEIEIARAPDYPGRTPDRAGDPEPPEPVVIAPASVMERGPAPVVVRDPGPAEVGPDPVAVGVGPPAVAHVPRDPDVAVAGIADPGSVGGEVIVEISGVQAGVPVCIVPVGVLVIRLGPRIGPVAVRDHDDAARRQERDQGDRPWPSFSSRFSFLAIATPIIRELRAKG